MFALFNLENKFIGFGDNIPDQTKSFFKTIEVPDQYKDFTKYTWHGNYNDGKFIEIKDITYVKTLEDKIEKITEKYSTQIQLINIIKQLSLLSKDKNLYDISFKEMSNDILNIWK
jgi:hypothetical protein